MNTLSEEINKIKNLINHNLGDTFLLTEQEENRKCFLVKDSGSFPINVTKNSDALKKFANKLINSFKEKTGNQKGLYKIEKLDLFGGASNYYGGKIEPDFGNDYKPWKQSKDYEKYKNTKFSGNKTKNNQLAEKRAKNVLDGLKSLLTDEGVKLGVSYDVKTEPKITSGTIFTNNNVDKKNSGLNAGQIVSITAEICFIPDTKKEPKEEPKKEPKEEPKKEPKEEPKKEEPKEKPKDNICDATGEIEEGKRGTVENNFVGLIKEYNFGDSKKVTVEINPLTVPDAFYVKYGNQEYFSGFIGEKFSDKHKYSPGVDIETKKLAVSMLPKWGQDILKKNLNDSMTRIHRNFYGELYKLQQNYNLTEKINSVITSDKIGGKGVQLKDTIPTNSEEVVKKIGKIGKTKTIYDDLKNIYKTFQTKEKKFTFSLNKEDGVDKITILVFAPLSKTQFTIRVKCEGEEEKQSV